MAARAGMAPGAFWHSTLFEAYTVIEADIWRRQQDVKTGAVNAWLTAAYSRAKRMPQLQAVLARLDGASADRRSPEAVAAARADFERMAAQMAPGAKILGRP